MFKKNTSLGQKSVIFSILAFATFNDDDDNDDNDDDDDDDDDGGGPLFIFILSAK